MARPSQVSLDSSQREQGEGEATPERRSRPSVRLVQRPEMDGSVPFAAVRGEAPGAWHPGDGVLRAGARVGILCDTLHGDPEVGVDLQTGLRLAAELIEQMGFVPVVDPIQSAVEPYFERWAGSVQARVEHFVRLVEDHHVDGLFPLFGKGGYHAVVDALAASHYRPARPIALIGGFSHHSDWSLFGQSARGRGFFSHIINTTQCAYWQMLPAENVHNLHSVLHHAGAVDYQGLSPVNAPARETASIEGVLKGGNLNAMLRNMHKGWCPDFGDGIVICEDYDLHPHDVHFRVTELLQRMQVQKARAVVLGAMLPAKRPAHAKLDAERRKREMARERAELAAVIREAASQVAVPVYQHAGLISHGAMNYPVGFGGHSRVTLQDDGSARLFNRLEVLS